MNYGRYFRAASIGLVVSVVVYGAAFWIYPKESGDASAWQDAFVWIGALGFFASVLALIGGAVAYAVKGRVA